MCNSRVCLSSLVVSLEVILDTIQECKGNLPPDFFISNNEVGELIFHKVVERMPITSVSEFVVSVVVVVCRQLLQTLLCNCAEVAREGCIVCKHHCASGYKAVDKRLRPHPLSHAFLSLSLSPTPLNPIFFPLHRNTLPSSVS
jgi:hypothetical protein